MKAKGQACRRLWKWRNTRGLRHPVGDATGALPRHFLLAEGSGGGNVAGGVW